MTLRLPNFICVGAQKAGTTTLFDVLRQHPDVFLPEQKETHFFYDDECYARGAEWYAQTYFARAGNAVCVGDITPEYLFWPSVPARIKETLGPDVRLVFMLRHPVDRAWSHYQMTRARGLESLDFEAALHAEADRLARDVQAVNHFSYMARSHYLEQVSRYMELFPRTNMHFMIFERDLAGGLAESMPRLLQFLGLPAVPVQTQLHSNEARAPRFPRLSRMLWMRGGLLKRLARMLLPPAARASISAYIQRYLQKDVVVRQGLDPVLRARLYEKHFRDEMRRLSQLTGVGLEHWER